MSGAVLSPRDADRPATGPATNPRLRVAVVGTLWREVRPLARRLGDRRGWRAAGRRFVQGSLEDVQVALSASGGGPGLAAEGTEVLLQCFPADRLIALGVAGGLTPDLEPGTVVVARQVAEAGAAVSPPDRSWAEMVLDRTATVAGLVVSAARIASDPAAKAEIWRRSAGRGSGVVDLESAAIARVAVARNLPYLVIRAVSDTAGETLPLDFERFRRPDGGIGQARVLLEALRRPALWRPLLRLRRRVCQCAESLADVVEEAVLS